MLKEVQIGLFLTHQNCGVFIDQDLWSNRISRLFFNYGNKIHVNFNEQVKMVSDDRKQACRKYKHNITR